MALEHLAACPVGQQLQVSATASYVDGRLHRFAVTARHQGDVGGGRLHGSGEVTRVVVDTERFLSRL